MIVTDALPELRIEGKPQCHIIAVAHEHGRVAASVGCALSSRANRNGCSRADMCHPGRDGRRRHRARGASCGRRCDSDPLRGHRRSAFPLGRRQTELSALVSVGPRRWGEWIQRSVRTSRGGIGRHRRQRGHRELHPHDVRGAEGDRRRGVLDGLRERLALDLVERNHHRRERPRRWDDERNDDRGRAGRGAIHRCHACNLRWGRGDPLPAGCRNNVEAGRSDPGQLQSGIRNNRQRKHHVMTRPKLRWPLTPVASSIVLCS